ncbi:dimethyl sulfoxide reductase anchor subunit family protein [Brenneria corticis]|uniref:Dimethyl sulfoxide reductase n=1 Tax=Brenneria corticis TaxID=2173106 RepID=A0A2U1TS04_9GAMM|nr:DmsC/YnfH family molybdoenzyme membrane anchor subunit [Brenneria sp. CFCC 11842]PWC12194.1 hypothetical protein DDT56_18310 [Brenneria sp. CFCC 11842]
MHEWPLIIFTLLMQLAIGCVVTVWYCQRFAYRDWDNDKRAAMARPPIVCALIVGGIGLLASVAHLGNPWHALYTLSHVTHSWMSREILFTALFMGLLFLSAAVLLVRKTLPMTLLGITALAGLADIFVMSAIYDNSRFILWQGWGTYAAFYGSSFMMGSLFGAMSMRFGLRRFGAGGESDLLAPLLRLYMLGFLLATLAVIVMFSSLAPNLAQGITVKTAAANINALTLSRYLLLTVALFLVATLMAGKRRASPGAIGALALIATITGEGVGRYVFFSLGG